MTSWLKTGLDSLFGFGADSPDVTPPTSLKRKSSADSRVQAKAQRYNADAYRNAPYGVPGPSRPRRERRAIPRTEAEVAAKAREAIARLKSDVRRGSKTFGLINDLESQLAEIEESPEVTRHRNLKLGGLPQPPVQKTNTFKGLFSSSESEDQTEEEDTVAQTIAYSPKPTAKLKLPQTTNKQPKLPNSSKQPSTTKPTIPKVNITPAKVNAPWKKDMTTNEKWTSRPNKLARQIVEESSTGSVKRTLQKSVKEPEYSIRDVEIRDGLWQIMDMMEKLTEKYFSGVVRQPRARDGILSAAFFEQFTAESAKIIGCVASGGPGGVHGWNDLFIDEQKRRALVAAIIGNVLVEQVFQHIFFGGSAAQIKTLMDLQETHRNADGFDRNEHYATYLRSILNDESSSAFRLPSNFANHVNHTVGVLYTHLTPFFALHDQPSNPSTLIAALHPLVTQAGLLSLSMRLDPLTVYHFSPVFKEDTFSTRRMECFNQTEMQLQNPREPHDHPSLPAAEIRRRQALPDAEKMRARADDALTQITIMHGVTAYRRGGWEDGASTLANQKFESSEWARMGVRVRMLTQGWVYCRWGRARRFRDSKADDVAAAHGAAWRGGFREFSDVEGVVDWLGLEREEGKQRGMAQDKDKDKQKRNQNESRAGTGLGEQAVASGAAKQGSKGAGASPRKSTAVAGAGGVSEMDLQAQIQADAEDDNDESMDFEI